MPNLRFARKIRPMTGPESSDRLRVLLVAGAPRGPDAPTPACLDDDVIAALADGSLDPPRRAAALTHVAQCPRCRNGLTSVARTLDAREVAAAVAAVEGSAWARLPRVVRVAVPLAAAGVVLLLAWPSPPPSHGPQHRAPTITAAPAPVPLSPMGASATARRFVWTAVSGADRYRVTVYAREGTVLYEAEVPDTTVLLPDSVGVTPGLLYLWKVEARTGIGRWTPSALVELSVPGGTPR